MNVQSGDFSFDEFVPVEVMRLVVREDEGEQSLVFLRESHGETFFPLAIGFCEAAALERLLAEERGSAPTVRPLTHELLVRAIEGLRAHVERGIITRLQQETFFAQLVLRPPDASISDSPNKAPGERLEVYLDARPSDVICASLVARCPLYVHRALLERISGGDET